MTKAEWEAIYREAWSLYYAPEHMKTLMRRAAAKWLAMASLVKMLVRFSIAIRSENLHPIQDGVVRRKHPSERRRERQREPAWAFWPRKIVRMI